LDGLIVGTSLSDLGLRPIPGNVQLCNLMRCCVCQFSLLY